MSCTSELLLQQAVGELNSPIQQASQRSRLLDVLRGRSLAFISDGLASIPQTAAALRKANRGEAAEALVALRMAALTQESSLDEVLGELQALAATLPADCLQGDVLKAADQLQWAAEAEGIASQ